MVELSPAAQAVLTAVTQRQYCLDPCDVPEATGRIKYEAAAALKAATDQVVPEHVEPVGDEHDDARHDQWMRIRYRFLAIVAELEGGE